MTYVRLYFLEFGQTTHTENIIKIWIWSLRFHASFSILCVPTWIRQQFSFFEIQDALLASIWTAPLEPEQRQSGCTTEGMKMKGKFILKLFELASNKFWVVRTTTRRVEKSWGKSFQFSARCSGTLGFVWWMSASRIWNVKCNYSWRYVVASARLKLSQRELKTSTLQHCSELNVTLEQNKRINSTFHSLSEEFLKTVKCNILIVRDVV